MKRLPGFFALFMVGGCFFIPIALSLAQLFLYLAVLVLAFVFIRQGRTSVLRSPISWGAWLFAVAAFVSIFTGHYFAESWSKCHRLLLLLLIPGLPYVSVVYKELSAPRLVQVMTFSFLGGVFCLALYDVIRVPLFVLEHVSWFDAGNMRDPQFYVVGLCLLAGGIRFSMPARRFLVQVLCAVFYGVALIFHFKRGAWFSLLAVVSVLGLMQRRWKALGGGLLLLLAVLFLPPVQERLADVMQEFSPHYGGRLDLWQHVAPRLIKDNLWGLGFKATEWSDLRKYHPHVAPGLDHLHNNVLSITAETGWLGGLVWMGFMGALFLVAWKSVRHYSGTEPLQASLALGWLLGFCALLLNGVVEYNFGDSELYMLFCVMGALQNVLWRERML